MSNGNGSFRKMVQALDDIQPPYDDPTRQPKTLKATARRDDVLYVAGKPPKCHEGTENVEAEIMFVAPAVEAEEASELHVSSMGYRMTQKAEYLRGAAGVMFRDVASRAGVFVENAYYTSVCKWLLPVSSRSKPSTKALKWGMPILLDEVKRVKPKIIVCLGKGPFDMLSDEKIGFDDAHGGWFWSSKAEAHLYVMRNPYMLVAKPEYFESFRVDLVEIARKLEILRHGSIQELPIRSRVIRCMSDLEDWIDQMIHEQHKLFSTDGEWHGNTHIDGWLRSFQFAWTESDAIYLRFRNEQKEFDFDMEGWQPPPDPDRTEFQTERLMYKEIGRRLARLLNKPDVKYVGHHYVADAVWLDHVLGLEVLGKCIMDTEFAQQTVDESSELKLERGIAMKYTTLGRYDLPLILWKKKNRDLCKDGYGYIPDDILIPYAIRDVLCVFRAVPIIRRLLEAQRLHNYYDNIFHPFVTDVFFTFAQEGLPMDIELMDELRDLFNYAKRELDKEFRVKMYEDAKMRLTAKLIELLGVPLGPIAAGNTVNLVYNGDVELAWNDLKTILPLDRIREVRPFIDHLAIAPEFNIRKPEQMRRWLFEVSGMTPIKTTNQKEKGMPSMAWDKVLELPKEKQALYTPSVDKQTVQIISEKLPLANQLLDLNVVGNVCKAFLKEPEVYWDEDLGEEVVEEAGLHQWLASNGRIHGQTSCTETGRPRGWRPNSLNWPSYVNERIGKSIARIIQRDVANGVLPPILTKWKDVKSHKDLPSIRSIVRAPEGYIFVESDYQTAEIRGLAYISGDENLIRLMNDDDPEWAFTNDGKKVRVAYAPFKDSGIPVHKQKPEYLFKLMEGGKVIKAYTLADMKTNPETGELVHCRYDLHWSLAEWTYEMPREEMIDKVHRAAGKVGNFSSAYGASPASLERKIESDTGQKPEEGTGQKLLDAIAARQPRATEFLEEMQAVPGGKGFYRAASERIRHCITHDRSSGVGYRQRNSIESAMGRELRNFPMQESVASTAARAGQWLGEFYRARGMKARVITILYDSVVTLCPLEERELCAHLHQMYMTKANNWVYSDERGERELVYPIDTEFNYRWSTKSKGEELAQVEDMSWHPTPEHLKPWLRFNPPKATPWGAPEPIMMPA